MVVNLRLITRVKSVIDQIMEKCQAGGHIYILRKVGEDYQVKNCPPTWPIVQGIDDNRPVYDIS